MAARWSPRAGWAITLGVTLALALWRMGSLHQPPVWDGAMGMTPAAITLERLGFDLSALLGMDDYRSGGPNLHALSAYTWLVASAIRVFGDYATALPYLHLTSFLLTGVLAAGAHRAARSAGVGKQHALVVAALAVLFPPMVVQASDVYLDLPLAAATTWALALALEGLWLRALAAACIAAAVKPSAVIVVPVMAWLILKQGRRRRQRLASLALPSAIAIIPVLMDGAMRQASTGPEVTVGDTTAATLTYLITMPGLCALILTVAALHWVSVRGSNRHAHDRATRKLSATALLLVLSYLLFFFLNPLASKGVPGLPRYTTMLSPILVAALVSGSARSLRGRAHYVPGALFLVLFVLSLGGTLEPRSRNLYPLAERSLAYEDLLSVQRVAFARFEELAGIMPTYYDHFAHYRFSYPETGWADGPPESGTPVRITSDQHWRSLANLPDQFAMLIEADWLGGEELSAIKRDALASREWSVDVEVFAEGEFANEVVVVRRNQ